MKLALIIYGIVNCFIAGIVSTNMAKFTQAQKISTTLAFIFFGLPVYIWFQFLERYFIMFQVEFFFHYYFTNKYKSRLPQINIERLRNAYRHRQSNYVGDIIFRYTVRKVFEKQGIEI